MPLAERSRGFGSDLRWSPDKEGDEWLGFATGGEAGEAMADEEEEEEEEDEEETMEAYCEEERELEREEEEEEGPEVWRVGRG